MLQVLLMQRAPPVRQLQAMWLGPTCCQKPSASQRQLVVLAQGLAVSQLQAWLAPLVRGGVHQHSHLHQQQDPPTGASPGSGKHRLSRS